ncbi:MAG: hypothetical protein KDB99_16160 [Chitinophagaceae bacterium]|nr:hypothetical protein [Chitinophagaceae bacterium]
MKFQQVIIFFLSMLGFLQVSAQDTDVIKVSVDKNRILIGEPLQLTVNAKFSPGSIEKGFLIDSIPHFEFLEEPVFDSSTYNKGAELKIIYKLTSFDSGHWVIPAFSINGGIKSDSIGIDVVFSDFDPSQDYHDVKDILEPEKQKKKGWWYIIAGSLLLLGLLVWYLLRRQKNLPPEKPVIVIDPYQEAMQRIAELQNTKLPVREYHSRLTGIFRLYVFRKRGILSLQKTTDDLVKQLKGVGLSITDHESLSRSLQLSDFVKFAKYEPSDEDNSEVLKVVKQTIEAMEGLT